MGRNVMEKGIKHLVWGEKENLTDAAIQTVAGTELS